MLSSIIIMAIIIVILLFFSAFFSGSETALTACSRARMLELEKKGNQKAVKINKLLKKPENFIGSILLGNNLVNILSSALATALFIELFGTAGIAYATISMTIIVLIFAEILPKTIAIEWSDRIALNVANPLSIIVKLFSPFAHTFQFIVKIIIKITNFEKKKQKTTAAATREELRGLISLQHLQYQHGHTIKNDLEMLEGILDLRELEVEDVIVHRTKMISININDDINNIIDEVLSNGFSRIPVWEDDPDDIMGILHAKDLLKELHKQNGEYEKIELKEIIKKPWFVPQNRKVSDQLNAFLSRKTHFAIVVDEYGEVMGLITLEDIIEEIIGEISDEHDVPVSGVFTQTSGDIIIEGAVPIRDLNRSQGWDLPEEEATTIAGLIIHEAQSIPDEGQAFNFYGYKFTIAKRQRNKITLLKITPPLK